MFSPSDSASGLQNLLWDKIRWSAPALGPIPNVSLWTKLKLSCGHMICSYPSSTPSPLSCQQVVSPSQSSCVSSVELTHDGKEEGWGGGETNQILVLYNNTLWVTLFGTTHIWDRHIQYNWPHKEVYTLTRARLFFIHKQTGFKYDLTPLRAEIVLHRITVRSSLFLTNSYKLKNVVKLLCLTI